MTGIAENSPGAARGLPLVGVDACRTFACAIVVVSHVNDSIKPDYFAWWPFGEVSSVFFTTAVPAFFLLAGFTAPALFVPGSTLPFSPWVRRKARQVLVPFLIWNLVMLQISPVTPWLRLLTGYGHLYFIVVLFQLWAIGFLFQWLGGSRWHHWMLIAACVIALFCYAWLEFTLWTGRDDLGANEGLAYRSIAPWFVFYAVGAWLRRERDVLQWLLDRAGLLGLCAGISFTAALGEWYLQGAVLGRYPHIHLLSAGIPFRIAAPLLLIVIFYRMRDAELAGRGVRALAAAGRYTYGIYLCHVPILIALIALMVRWNVSPFDIPGLVPILAVITWLLAYGLVVLSRGSALGGILFGTSK
jgi:peptidoglycan/LPS O-acetylase OafA/YrhL